VEKQIGRTATSFAEGLNGGEGSSPLRRSGETASGEVLGLCPASGVNSRLAHRETTPRLGSAYHPDCICRTAVYVIRIYGGVTGKAREGLPMSIRPL